MHVFTYAHMLLHAWLVTCVHGRSYYPMLTHECSLMNAHTLSCFHDHMLPRSHSLLIICYYATCFEDNMLTYFDIHIFDIHTYEHTWLIICHYSWRLKRSCSCTFVRSNVLMIMLECKDNWTGRGMCT